MFTGTLIYIGYHRGASSGRSCGRLRGVSFESFGVMAEHPRYLVMLLHDQYASLLALYKKTASNHFSAAFEVGARD